MTLVVTKYSQHLSAEDLPTLGEQLTLSSTIKIRGRALPKGSSVYVKRHLDGSATITLIQSGVEKKSHKKFFVQTAQWMVSRMEFMRIEPNLVS